VVENADLDLLEFQVPRCQQPAVPRDDARMGIDQDGVIESELAYAGGDLRYSGISPPPEAPPTRRAGPRGRGSGVKKFVDHSFGAARNCRFQFIRFSSERNCLLHAVGD
jgi:hypothetical protein